MDNAQLYVQHLDGENYDMAVQAIRDCYMVIGEAAKSLPSESRDRHPEIEWSRVIGMRNIGTHEYFKFNIDIAKRAVSESFPTFRPVIEAIARGE